jgi:hypothetical protein
LNKLLKKLVKKSFVLAGWQIQRTGEPVEKLEFEDGNLAVPKIWTQPFFKQLLPFRLDSGRALVLVGNAEQLAFLGPCFSEQGHEVKEIKWDWESGTELGPVPAEARIILCHLPGNETQWRVVRQLKERYGSRVTGIQELTLPFVTIHEAQLNLPYAVQTMQAIAPFYSGDQYFGPLDELNKVFPLSGKRIIEFGPMEGAQTAGLVQLGARSVTAIEARGGSFIKTMVARYCLNWNNVELIMDDFHNADRQKYGEFDLAFAHGVYYHSFVPFFFLENLMSLSDNIFIGGYCISDSVVPKPSTKSFPYTFETLEYQGRRYKVKRFKSGNTYNSPVNEYAYHFDRKDLLAFFADRGYELTVLYDADPIDPWGDWYLRFLACKKSAHTKQRESAHFADTDKTADFAANPEPTLRLSREGLRSQ